MKAGTTFIIMLIASYIIASFIMPPDPYARFLLTGAIMLVAVPSYIVGLMQSSRRSVSETRKAINSAANTE